MASTEKFRKDINGLRAIAVLLVLIFHYSSNWLSGGFLGVDVFFVISGYLMTSIIFNGVLEKKFNLFKFILARAKRIVPSLTVVVALVLLFGYFFIEPLLYKPLAEHAFSSLLFFSNNSYSNEFGYFDLGADSKFLLHTWSLSVEWQFYFLYPLIIIAVAKILSLTKAKIIILIFMFSSFAFMMYEISYGSKNIYYNLLPRVWEMLVGAVAFLYPLRIRVSKAPIEFICVGAIVVSAFTISSSDAWPGPLTLIPIVATYLIIATKNDGFFLNFEILQKVGIISYSLYLVHWPLLTLSKQYFSEINFWVYLIACFLFSVVLYKLVDSRRKFGAKWVIFFLITLAASFFASKNGFSDRLNDKYSLTSKEYHLKYYGGGNYRSLSDVSYINMEPAENPDVIVTGDSYMRQYVNYFEKNNIKVVNVFKDDCFSTENYYTSKWHDLCEKRHQNFLDVIDRYPNVPIVIGQAWRNTNIKIYSRNDGSEIKTPDAINLLLKDFDKIFEAYPNRIFYIIGNTQGVSKGVLTYSCLAKEALPIFKNFGNLCPSFIEREKNKINDIVEEGINKNNNAFFVDPERYLCNEQKCRVLDENRDPIYSDRGHLSIYGANYIGQKIFEKILK